MINDQSTRVSVPPPRALGGVYCVGSLFFPQDLYVLVVPSSGLLHSHLTHCWVGCLFEFLVRGTVFNGLVLVGATDPRMRYVREETHLNQDTLASKT